ncbi:type II secretion system protein [Fuerstiella marisgermanici]|uniref:Type II secretion system protein G n=1 Tax=Fuerstiella marisgermanici TaxID=1891926 RepID=A0A1P8WFH8_9PLAN|nr:prepilin-type N-terminal cleavage/methylation domain-containing protein [Fuerstiella marisgermanici]APZ92828.1 type II secretion system protein G [Fuerstiella marisgermanici]
MKRPTNHNSNHRSAFTLLELLAVITIISILLALILPAIGQARRSADETALSVELKQLEQALASFKARFNRYPPSSITLWDTAAEWNTHPNDKAVIRSMWRDFDFTTGGRGPAAGHPWAGTDKELTGDECLVFFLGGVPVANGAGVPPTLAGFSKNGKWPFAIGGENRDGPFFTEWKDQEARLVDDTPSDSGPDEIYSYTDGLGTNQVPMWYSAADNGRYLNGDPVYYQGDGKTPWNRDTFQLIAPGSDDEFGNIQQSATFKAIWTEGMDMDSTRSEEKDNITNFSGGRLSR